MVALLILVVGPHVCRADDGGLAVPPIISDGMVLQSGVAAPIWGTARAGVEVTVEFAGEQANGTAGPDGRWEAVLGPLDVSAAPRTMTIRSDGETVAVAGVKVGEVWVAAGQSNMWYPLSLMTNREAHREAFDALQDVSVFRAVLAHRADQWDAVDYERALGTSAVACYFMRDLSAALPGVPIAVIDTSVAATWAEGWMSKTALEAYNADPAHEQKIVMDGSDYGGNPDFQPTRWYEGIIAKVLPYGVRGVIWYQGEGNAAKPRQHDTLLPALIAQWRRDFRRPDMPFLLCQLPPFYTRPPWDPKRQFWAYFRESQLRVWQSVPNTAMAVAPECGAAGNIHSRHKDEFGERLALAARAVAYGEDIVYSGPIFRDKQTDGNRITISFDHAGSGLVVKGGGELKQFEVCGADGQYFPARAEIVGDTVVVSSPDVAEPLHVRYAWANYPADTTELDKIIAALTEESEDQPEPEKWLGVQLDERYAEDSDYPVEMNLYNVEGLPASPFRTDDFPLNGP